MVRAEVHLIPHLITIPNTVSVVLVAIESALSGVLAWLLVSIERSYQCIIASSLKWDNKSFMDFKKSFTRVNQAAHDVMQLGLSELVLGSQGRDANIVDQLDLKLLIRGNIIVLAQCKR